ncbi:MAG: rhodanese-like domain-containing protein [Jatrophihabitantaceae bacterium]
MLSPSDGGGVHDIIATAGRGANTTAPAFRLAATIREDKGEGTVGRFPRRGIDDVLSEARGRLVRLRPHEAYRAQQAGAVLVDIRPQASREAEGRLPGALVVERTVLEWRLDPASEARLPFASYDLHVVVVCNEGYSSSLAAASLQDIGIHRATDLDGGFRAWRLAGLPAE